MPLSPPTSSLDLPSLLVCLWTNAHPLLPHSAISIPCPSLHDAYLSHRGELLYLGGDSASKQYGVAEIEGGGVREHPQPVPAMGCHAEGAVPLVQGEEERGEMQRDKNPHPHGPVERPHEGSDGGCSVPAAYLSGQNKVQVTGLIQLISLCRSYMYFTLCQTVIINQPPVLRIGSVNFNLTGIIIFYKIASLVII